VELELQLESIRKALIEATEDSSGVEQLKQEALAGY
jgi:rod shape-determining protein MreC